MLHRPVELAPFIRSYLCIQRSVGLSPTGTRGSRQTEYSVAIRVRPGLICPTRFGLELFSSAISPGLVIQLVIEGLL